MKTTRFFAIAALAALTLSCINKGSKQQSDGMQNQMERSVKDAIEITDASSGKWVDNEYTRLVPKPDMEVREAANTGMGYSIVFGRSVTLDRMKAYAEKLKQAGFNVDCGDEDNEQYYSFWGDNADGWSVRITVTSNANNLLISKPGEM